MGRMPGLPSPQVPEEVMMLVKISPVSARIEAFMKMLSGNPGLAKYKNMVCRELPPV